MPDISFIIPFYRKSKTIYRCLKSLYDQSIKDFEVIVVFDGPDDEGLKIVNRFKRRGVKVLQIPHGGACAARNAGAEVATGKFISFWDADCYIKPDAAAVWLQVFRKYPDVDFVYAGYEFPEGMGAVASDNFDPWLLKVNNYISGMFPIKREKAPKWDPELKSLQDWDFWLTAVENGCRGYRLMGYSFITEPPDPESISGKGCTPENWLDRLNAVKNKHGIPRREMCISAIHCRDYGISLAKLMEADYRDVPTHIAHDYKSIVQVGFHPKNAAQHAEIFKDSMERVKKVLFWRGEDAAYMRRFLSGEAAEALALLLTKSVPYHFCEDKGTKELLRRMGITAEILPLPMEPPKDITPLPDKVRLLVDVEAEYAEFFSSITRACPDIEFVKLEGSKNVDQFHGLIQLLNDRSLTIPAKQVLLNGRYMVSNTQALYCGYVSEHQPLGKLRAEIIRKVREIQAAKEPNMKAANFYAAECSPQSFKAKLNERIAGGVQASKIAEAVA